MAPGPILQPDVKKQHFEALCPVCPVCRGVRPEGAPLAIAGIDRGDADHIVEGILHCSNQSCKREYPIVDGIPLLIAPLRSYLADNILALYGRQDLSQTTESILGDCCGAGSAFDQNRQHLSSYAWDHYGDLDPQQARAQGPDRPGACVRMLQAALAQAPDIPPGPILDMGCSCGRATFALAERASGPVLGIDLHLPTLRLAAGVIRRRAVRYPHRRVGLVYHRREFAVDLPGMDEADFWACDATTLPFAAHTFAACIALNVFDSVSSPVGLLRAIAQVLRPGGIAVISCPYDWSPAVTPIESWVGGHSQRGDDRGSSAAILRQLLTPGALPQSVSGLDIVAEIDRVPWHVRMHERSLATYQSHVVIARASG